MITPAQDERIMKEAIADVLDDMLETLRIMTVEGLPLPGHKPNAATELLGYQRDTVPSELPMALGGQEYLDAMHAGQAPEFVPQVWYPLANGQHVAGPFATPDEAIREALRRRLPPNPDGSAPIEPKNNFWSQLCILPTKKPKPGSFIPFLFHSARFKKLIEMQADHADGMMLESMT